MEKLYANRFMPGGSEWIPFLSDRDGWTGKFIDVRDGRIGRWFVGEITITGEYASLGHYLDSVAETLTKIADGNHPVREVAEGRLVWS
ncbi:MULTISPECIES: hypothetical protein [unclassified Streptomyces]|uniref:hypothetical protein n=1 Tax=unclassified Streptomyces TaxID=2593676 RepID=UPI001F1FFB26|nr:MULTISPECIES: hypothetical protein [unclassified Streptomyces]